MNFNELVDLYREAGKPKIIDGKFSCELDLSEKIAPLLRNNFTLIDELLIDGNFISTQIEIVNNGKASFLLRLPTSGGERFFNSIDDLLKVTSVSKGYLPKTFYLIDCDYCYGEKAIPLIESLEIICEMIRKLSDIAIYQDVKSIRSYHKLIFFSNSTGNQTCPVELETFISLELLSSPPPDLNLLNELVNDDNSSTIHYHTKRTLFSSTLTEFLKQRPDDKKSFAYLIENWPKFLEHYNNDFSTYLSGFSFHKAKTEVAKSEIDLADQFSKVLGDINSKLLSVPLSIAGIIAIIKSTTFLESIFLLCGLFIISWLIWESVKNQIRQFTRIVHAKNLMFNSFEGNKENYPIDLRDAINNLIAAVNDDQNSLNDKLLLFQYVSWIPFAAGLVVFFHSEGFFLHLWQFFWKCLFYGCGVQ